MGGGGRTTTKKPNPKQNKNTHTRKKNRTERKQDFVFLRYESQAWKPNHLLERKMNSFHISSQEDDSVNMSGLQSSSFARENAPRRGDKSSSWGKYEIHFIFFQHCTLGPRYVKLLWTTHSRRLWKVEDPLLWIFQSNHWYWMLSLNLAGRSLSSWVLRQVSFVFCVLVQRQQSSDWLGIYIRVGRGTRACSCTVNGCRARRVADWRYFRFDERFVQE